jgi:hypothetical protein
LLVISLLRYRSSGSRFLPPLKEALVNITREQATVQATDSFTAESTGLEPATSALTGQRSNQLSYDSKAHQRTAFQLASVGNSVLVQVELLGRVVINHSGGSRIRTLIDKVGACHASRYTNPPKPDDILSRKAEVPSS